ncbi:MAG: SRPBCC family protein [Actinomycetota bacterium]
MPTHELMGPEWIDEAPARVEESIEIEAAPSEVWPHIADHERWPEWFTDLDRVEPVDGGAGVGSGRRVTVAKFVTLTEEFTAWRPDERFAFAVIGSPLPFLARLAEDVRLEPTDAGTRVVYRQGIEARRFLGVLHGPVAKQVAGQVRSALTNLKRRVEDGA